MATTLVGLLLLPPSQLTATLHMASIAFNSDGTENLVWEAYQDACAPEECTSPGMSLELRLRLLTLVRCGNVLVLVYERVAIVGPLRDWLHHHFVASQQGQAMLNVLGREMRNIVGNGGHKL